MLILLRIRRISTINPSRNYLLLLMLLILFCLQLYMKTPFSSKDKGALFCDRHNKKSERRTDEHEDQIKVNPQVALVKDLVTNDVLDSNINFCAVSTNIVTAKNKGHIFRYSSSIY